MSRLNVERLNLFHTVHSYISFRQCGISLECQAILKCQAKHLRIVEEQTSIDRDSTHGDAVRSSCATVSEDNIIVAEIQFEENAYGGIAENHVSAN